MRYKDIISLYRQHCTKNNISFESINSIRPYDDSTLFCIAGMQQYKNDFQDTTISGITISNIQPCLRLNDIDEIGDGTHLLYFQMIGLFSFRSWTVKQTIDFYLSFLKDSLGIIPDYVTVHPDKIAWKEYYKEHQIPVAEDGTCIWTDGNLGGYCTEFYYKNVEIGNIVNCNEDCIDVGFGFERINQLVNNLPPKSHIEILHETIQMIISSGYKPSNKEQGYVLRKLLRLLSKRGGTMNHEYFNDEVQRQEKLTRKYHKLKSKHQDKPKEWWFDTHGIDIDDY